MTDASNSPQQQEDGRTLQSKGETPFIEMRGISKRFGGVRALQDVSFSIHSAEIHSLAGENGCGKSTLIKVLSGVHVPDEGADHSGGQGPFAFVALDASQRFGVQIIYQDLSLFPNLTVAENIAFRHHVETPVRVANRNVMRKQAQAVMDRLKVSLPLDELVGKLPDCHAPTGGDLPRAGGGGAAGRHGRADRVPEPPGGRGTSGCGS